MVETIAPVVHGRRRGRYWLTVALHLTGAVAAGAALGAILGALGAALGAPWGAVGLVALAAVAGTYAAREALGVPVPLPDLKRQVPYWWRTFYSAPVAALLYGVGLGPGFLTFLSFGTYVAVTAGAVVSGSPWIGAILGGAFGAARALSVTVSARTTDEDGAAAVVDRLEDVAATPLPRAVNAASLVAIAAVAVAAA